ncbi:helix-turn-helix domain-containing protein [Dyadobacter frigoris]|uniref:AraC family transcriptional regulator n=1 Tax=Dyadobacter frigoris TaxID=2576211 RepID=A0A4U6D8D8_9BACT|nr:helix-turn-helix domain-containing protein [Dyadobacter frigoris]TKT92601.1 AraC family transcriptional regulator [Dyadobacter frigoris]GLU51487.1 AraC family transcriptional regulator [Dyadobacter frigoris]
MAETTEHIPLLNSISDFFRVYGLGKPVDNDIMCMRLQDQPDKRLMTMPLCRTNFYRLIHLTSENLFHVQENKKTEIGANTLIFSYPGKLESWSRSGKLYGNVIYFSKDFLPLDTVRPGYENMYPYFTADTAFPLPITDQQALTLKLLSDEMIEEIDSASPDKIEMLRKLLTVYLHKIKRIYLANTGTLTEKTKENRLLYNLFRKHLESYIVQLGAGQQTVMPSVSALAEMMNVNPNYLNSSVKKVTGQTASVIIQEKLLLEAKAYLIHTSLQVAEIAYRLGFENLSYFNRFFKKHTQTTPSEFRKSIIL